MSIKLDSILVFGGGQLQLSIIKKCIELNLYTVVIDPNPNAFAKGISDVFEIVNGDDYESTCYVVEKYAVKGIVTSSTDKPLVMMARIASKYNLPFFSIETAMSCTDKSKMKEVFIENDILCASGYTVSNVKEITSFPVIIKPKDNSGSRGVFYCESEKDASELYKKCFEFTNQSEILIEKVIYGKEYSVEALHQDDKTKVLQITQKTTTTFPNNVEVSHLAPAQLTDEILIKIVALISNIAKAFKFKNCASHTELKIENNNIVVIETSPRLGGDFITSCLVPLSTKIDMESALISIALGCESIITKPKKIPSAIFYFQLPEGMLTKINNLGEIESLKGVKKFVFDLKVGDVVPKISNSLQRYGYVILTSMSLDKLMKLKDEIFLILEKNIVVHRGK